MVTRGRGIIIFYLSPLSLLQVAKQRRTVKIARITAMAETRAKRIIHQMLSPASSLLWKQLAKAPPRLLHNFYNTNIPLLTPDCPLRGSEAHPSSRLLHTHQTTPCAEGPQRSSQPTTHWQNHSRHHWTTSHKNWPPTTRVSKMTYKVYIIAVLYSVLTLMQAALVMHKTKWKVFSK